jgi:MSHA biogenesis protein MshO
MTRSKPIAGFTLVEMIIVIVITGVVATMITVFMKAPIDGYFSSIRRATLSEEADAALRFVARDLQAALPNSIVCTGSGLQFLSTRSGGRFREAQTSSGTGAPLAFGTATTGFDIIGAAAESVTKDARGNSVAGLTNRVVVGNLSSGVANCHSDFSAFVSNAASLSSLDAVGVTFGDNTYPTACNMASSTVQDDPATVINEINDREFGRFFVVNSTPVTYVCNTTNGLTRNGVGVVAASHLSACQVACDSTKARVQLVTMNLTLKNRDNEPVNMLRRVTIVNRP